MLSVAKTRALRVAWRNESALVSVVLSAEYVIRGYVEYIAQPRKLQIGTFAYPLFIPVVNGLRHA